MGYGIKKILTILVTGLVLLSATFIYINISKYKEQEVVILDRDNWTTLASREAFGEKYISVINHVNSPGSVIIQINDGAGNPIEEKTILAGNSNQFNPPIIEGDKEVTIKAKAESNEGTYVIVVREDWQEK